MATNMTLMTSRISKYLTVHMFRKILLSLALILFVCNTSHAQIRTYSNEFLNLGVGARSLAMGNVQVAAVQDVTSAYWNPAGLTGVDNFQMSFMHAEWFAGQGKYDYLGVALPILGGDKGFGVSVVRFGVDDIPNTLFIVEPDGSINYDKLSTFSAADYGVYLSYAQMIRKLQVGGSAKIIRRKVGSFANSWGFGIDLGLQYVTNSKWKLGLVVRNVTTTVNAWSFDFTESEQQVLAATNNEIPVSSTELTAPEIVLGAAKVFVLGNNASLLAELDLNVTTDGQRNVLVSADPISVDPRFGLELGYKNFLFLRGGVNNVQQFTDNFDPEKSIYSIQPNAGLGLVIKNITLDYAFTGLNNTSTGFFSHVISLKLNWNNENNTNDI